MCDGGLVVRCDAVVGSLRLQVEERLEARWTVIFGASGSGKSSLLRLICGLWQPRNCAVSLDGTDLTGVPAERRRIGLVAQRTSLFPHRTVIENIRFGASRTPEGTAWVSRVVEELHLAGLLKGSVRTLSGGERQRVELARALAARPCVLLLDEAFAGLHATLRSGLIARLRPLCSEMKMRVVSVTHDVSEALSSADEVLRLQDGRVAGRGAPVEILDEERGALLRQLGRL